MKYSIQCRYSIVEQTFMFLIRSTENKYQFTWLISNVDKPIYVLTNNNIILKAEMEDGSVSFSVAQSEKPLNENVVMTKTIPILTFETDEQELEIIYDYDHLPNEKEKFVGKIVHEFLQIVGGGFLQTVDDYNQLENNISNILDDYVKLQTKTEVKTTQKKKRTVKKAEPTEVKEETNTEQIKAKTTVKRTRKTSKKAEVSE